MLTKGQLDRYASSLDDDGKTNLLREIGNIKWDKENPTDPDIVCLDSQAMLAFQRAGLITDTRNMFKEFSGKLAEFTQADDTAVLAPYDRAAGLATSGADRY
jgi:hypothetical protein